MDWQTLQEEWQDYDPSERLQALIEWADKLPPLSEARRQIPRPEECRVWECQTPVWVWVELVDGRVHLEADVPRESPAVRGLVALLLELLEGTPAQEVLHLPDDLLPVLGLQDVLGMTRRQGVRGMIRHIQRELRRQMSM